MSTLNRLPHNPRCVLAACLLAGGFTSSAQAAQITSLAVTAGEFRMGAFTPLGPVPYSFVGTYDLINDFPTTIGWDVNVGQNSQDGTVCHPTSVVCFNFGDPLVNTFSVPCDPQVVDGCDVNPHAAPSGTVAGGAATIADGDSIVVNIPGLYANWNAIDFNQGGTTGDGVAYQGAPYEFVYTSTVSNVNGTAFDYDMTWTSLIVGGPFDGQIGAWTFRGNGTVAAVANLPKTDPGLTLSPNNFSQIAGITTGDLVAAGLPLPGADQDCVGGCWDFIVTGLAAPGDSARVVIPLGSGIPSPGSDLQSVEVWKLDTVTATWRRADRSVGDEIWSAPLAGNVCPDPGDPAYTPALTAGNQCIQLIIADGSPNDGDGVANQQITDPGSLVLVTNPRGETDIPDNGCTLASTRSDPLKHADWWLITGFLAWLGVTVQRRRRRLH